MDAIRMDEYYNGKNEAHRYDNVYSLEDHFGIAPEEIERTRKTGILNGIKIEETKKTRKGYAFIGPYNVTIGQIYKRDDGRYEMIINRDAKEEIKRRYTRRKLKIQRTSKAVAIGTAGVLFISALTSGIGSLIDGHKEKQAALEAFRNQEQTSIEMLYEAPTAVQVSWANYEMGMLRDDVAESEYSESLNGRVDTIYQSSFIKMNSKYCDMCEMNELGLSEEVLGQIGYSTRVKDEFKTELSQFSQDVKEIVKNDPDYLFVNSPYANAVVLDEKPKSDTVVYIPLTELPENSPYNVNNLPQDAVILEGKVYVPEQYLYATYSNTINK